MARRKSYRPVMTGVSFHPAVIAYLDRSCDHLGCDRSALINLIVRRHALARGNPVEPRDAAAIPESLQVFTPSHVQEND